MAVEDRHDTALLHWKLSLYGGCLSPRVRDVFAPSVRSSFFLSLAQSSWVSVLQLEPIIFTMVSGLTGVGDRLYVRASFFSPEARCSLLSMLDECNFDAIGYHSENSFSRGAIARRFVELVWEPEPKGLP